MFSPRLNEATNQIPPNTYGRLSQMKIGLGYKNI
uniref:Uncharacterized protein n=1 Tax=Anguilla anguilla TaxID=7936 RepID=A0A0E9S7K6_ANGAN